ncbi:MAG: gliding motility-associated C-terminal domain-containing protein, partial [Bacteroidota bacterium]
PPYEDTWYILTATDEMGMVEVDSVFYESIQTKATFTVEYWDKFRKDFYSDLTGDWKNPVFKDSEIDRSSSTGSTDATLTVRFKNESLNGATFEWVFLDTLGGVKETATTYDTTEMPEFTYIAADEYYYPYLFSYSEEGCVDSVKMEEGIFVEPSDLSIPNVFTPNGDNKNDIWYFKHQSLKTCKITVVDRAGKVVYKKKIEDIYSWEGWNGNMHESGREAPVGQYYYVVEAMGYDGFDHSDPTIWETMKIFGGPGKQSTGSTGGSGGTTPGGGTGTEPQSGNLYTGWLYLFR